MASSEDLPFKIRVVPMIIAHDIEFWMCCFLFLLFQARDFYVSVKYQKNNSMHSSILFPMWKLRRVIYFFADTFEIYCRYGLYCEFVQFSELILWHSTSRLKGISICFSMLKAALSGNYVNFGVFRLYGDSALDDTFQTFVKLLLSITQNNLLVSRTSA